MKSAAAAAFSLIALVALTACGGNKSSGGNASRVNASPAPAPSMDCNGESPVWALSSPKVYLVEGDRLYGKTKHGKYFCLSQAQAEGYQPARQPFRHHRHHRPER
ncbi:MAG TPA: hypothetical protein VMT95_08470 [Candidatus Binatia bacterium]|nr:hypothetical protein [Candidatus Binatia bacterium]